jgi:putative endopeptidase
MSLLSTKKLVVIFACAVSLCASGASSGPNANVDDTVQATTQALVQAIDPSIKPGDNFYLYANGSWLKTAKIPDGQQSFDNRAILVEKTGQRVHDLIQEAASSQPVKGSSAQKVGDYYATFMDQDSIESKGLKPLANEMAAIAAITNKASLSAYFGATLNTEVDGLTANADHVFGVLVNQSFSDSKHYVFHLLQGGLGMPVRDNYLDPSPKMAAERARYQEHVAAILKLAGISDSDTKAAKVLSLEIRMAQTQAPDSDATDVFKQNNPWKRSEFDVKAPGMDWKAYFKSAGVEDQSDFIVWQPSAVPGTSALVASEDIAVWKDYLLFHLIAHYSSVLPKAVTAILSDSPQTTDRSKEAIAATNAALGQAVGQLYTQLYFPPEAKARVQAMVADLITAYRGRISNLAWMSPETKKKALDKLSALKIGVGYPDTWIDYSTLDVVRGDAVGNMRRAEAFNRSLNLAKLKRPADPNEWRIDPQTVGAIILFSPNTETFSAGILQPPYFDYQGDDASNYGSAGAGMAHEISHSFDELGNIYDDQGRLGMWWTPDDLAKYHAAAARVKAQFNSNCPLADVCVNGKQVLSENIADIAGLLVAHDAYVLSLKEKLKGKPDAVIGGLTGEQRFFLAFAQRWRRNQTEAALRRQLKNDTHSPGEFRSDTVRNIDSWYKAYGVTPGDKLYLKPEDRVGIW